MKASTVLVLIVLISLAAVLAGCTSSQTASSAGSSGSPGAASSSATPTLTTSPTDVMPPDIAVTVTVGEKDYLGNIPVTFNGGKGQINVNSVQVILTKADGTTQTATLGSDAGDIVNLAGTRGTGSYAGEFDRVQVYVTMNNGLTYKVADVLRQYRSRSGSGE